METEGEEERALEPEEEIPTDFLQSPVIDGPHKGSTHRRQPVTVKIKDPFMPNHARPDPRKAGPNLTNR